MGYTGTSVNDNCYELPVTGTGSQADTGIPVLSNDAAELFFMLLVIYLSLNDKVLILRNFFILDTMAFGVVWRIPYRYRSSIQYYRQSTLMDTGTKNTSRVRVDKSNECNVCFSKDLASTVADQEFRSS